MVFSYSFLSRAPYPTAVFFPLTQEATHSLVRPSAIDAEALKHILLLWQQPAPGVKGHVNDEHRAKRPTQDQIGTKLGALAEGERGKSHMQPAPQNRRRYTTLDG